MRNAIVSALICILGFCNSCDLTEDAKRIVTCFQPEDFYYLDYYDYSHDTLCTTELCSTYTAVWKDLKIDRTTVIKPYFDRHFEIISTSISSGTSSNQFSVGYRIQNEWAIAYGADFFVIRIGKETTDFPEIGLPRDTFLSSVQISALLDNKGFNSKIYNTPKTGPLKYASRE